MKQVLSCYTCSWLKEDSEAEGYYKLRISLSVCPSYTHTHIHTHTYTHTTNLSLFSPPPSLFSLIQTHDIWLHQQSVRLLFGVNHTYKNDTISHTQTHKPKSTHTHHAHTTACTHITHTRTHTNTHSSSYTRTAAENKASFLYLGMHVTGMANFSFLCY